MEEEEVKGEGGAERLDGMEDAGPLPAQASYRSPASAAAAAAAAAAITVAAAAAGLERLLLRNPSYDPRSLLQGVGSFLGGLARKMVADPCYLMAAFRPLPLPWADRAAVQQVLSEAIKVREGHPKGAWKDRECVCACERSGKHWEVKLLLQALWN
jgi:hypothetical protein